MSAGTVAETHPSDAREFVSPRSFSAFGVSLVVHIALLAGLFMIHRTIEDDNPDIVMDTVFTEELLPEQMTQDVELDTTPSETMSTVSGGTVTGNVGSVAAAAVAQANIETSDKLKEPELRINPGPSNIPTDNLLGEDLGETQIKGETGAVVDGYGTALHRITLELVRLMHKQRVFVVWLFDESESMRDDQKEIAENFHKVYADLGLAQQKDEKVKTRGKEVLLTAVVSYGAKVNEQLKPSTDTKAIEETIATKIPIDESGSEMMCSAVATVIQQYRKRAIADQRKLVVILVSDESGDDGEGVEVAIETAKKARASIYVLGRESVFGYPYARVRWKDKKYGLWHWLRINRGPETGMPECLQWDGLHARWDVHNAGFGPYEQTRMARETGGIFFVLPGEEEDLAGRGARDRRKYDFLDMKEYQPLLLARKDYVQQRDASKFRSTIWQVIRVLNPHLDDKLNVREHHYPIDKAEFAKVGGENFQRAMYGMAQCNTAMKLLESIRPLRDSEESQRWRAAYDLADAQIPAYRVRLFQFKLALDKHLREWPAPKKENTNEWWLHRSRKLLEPTEAQIKLTKVDMDELNRQKKLAEERYQFVINEHPNTPWARRAQADVQQGFGMDFHEHFHDPRYYKLDIKIPKF